jgi:hypothetical protein
MQLVEVEVDAPSKCRMHLTLLDSCKRSGSVRFFVHSAGPTEGPMGDLLPPWIEMFEFFKGGVSSPFEIALDGSVSNDVSVDWVVSQFEI